MFSDMLISKADLKRKMQVMKIENKLQVSIGEY
jgi:hypothetical protein